jgi:hypothetical protein
LTYSTFFNIVKQPTDIIDMASGELPYEAPSLNLDPSLYQLDDKEKAFFQQLIGITSDEELKEHIIKVQAKAFEVCCVFSPIQPSGLNPVGICLSMHQDVWICEVIIPRSKDQPMLLSMYDLRLRIARLPGYKHALNLLSERKDPILLDLGCCCESRMFTFA